MKLKFLYFGYLLSLSLYALLSYSLTAPNLILSSNPIFWRFQEYMWETFFHNKTLLTFAYGILFILSFYIYFCLVRQIKLKELKFSKNYLWAYLVLIMPLIFANNALSYDVFNYIFNAKILMVYKANPHVVTATNYLFDDWTRFMHNTHTPAPYGYVWTLLSLIPFSLGLGKFLLTWFSFKLWSVLSVALYFLSLKFLARKANLKLNLEQLSLIFLNPLFLIEIISNAHNDLWMIWPVLLSFGFLIKYKNRLSLFLSLILLIFSINIKFATLGLLPIYLILIFKPKLIKNKIFLIASVLLFLPLFLTRSKQFLPWYLLWSLSFLPLLTTTKTNLAKFWQNLLIIFSFTSLLRYLPFLYFGEYSALIINQQKAITWSAIILAIGLNFNLLKRLFNWSQFKIEQRD